MAYIVGIESEGTQMRWNTKEELDNTISLTSDHGVEITFDFNCSDTINIDNIEEISVKDDTLHGIFLCVGGKFKSLYSLYLSAQCSYLEHEREVAVEGGNMERHNRSLSDQKLYI